MLITQELFLGGRWVKGSSGQWLTVVCPITEKPMGRAVVPTFREINAALAAAREALDNGPWPRMSVGERGAQLRRVMQIFDQKYLDTAVALQSDEMGAPESFTRFTTASMTDVLEQLIADAADVTLTETRRGVTGLVRVLREPIGVGAAIIPWEAPLLAAAVKLFPALLMGCPMVLKTSAQTPFSGYLLAQAISEAGLPEGLVSIVPGKREIGAYLISHPQVDTVTFTGTTTVGRSIASVCGHRLKPVSCELGGKSAAILAPGVDIPTHLDALLEHSLTNNGQLHIATSRVLVHADQADVLRDALVDALSAAEIGDPHDASTTFGPVVSERQRDRVEGYIASGQAQGATLAYGGARPAHLPVGYYIEPAVFVDVDNDMAIARDEIFGPVLSVISYRTEAEAVALANDSDYGFGGSVYSDDPHQALQLAAALRTGTCAINDAPFAGGGGPFGGTKASGLGRHGGVEGLMKYVKVKSIALPKSWTTQNGAQGTNTVSSGCE